MEYEVALVALNIEAPLLYPEGLKKMQLIAHWMKYLKNWEIIPIHF